MRFFHCILLVLIITVIFSNATRPIPRTLEEKKAVSDDDWETNSLPAKREGKQELKEEEEYDFCDSCKDYDDQDSSNEDDEDGEEDDIRSPPTKEREEEKSSEPTKCTGPSCDGEAAAPQPAKGNSKSEGKDTDSDAYGHVNDKDGDADGGGGGGGGGDDDKSSPPLTRKKPKCDGPTCDEDSEMASPPVVLTEKGKATKSMAPPPTNEKQGPNKNGSAKQAPPKDCDDPSCNDDFEMASSLSAKGKDVKSTAPPPTNKKQIPEELKDGDVAQTPDSDDPEMDFPPKFQPTKGSGAKSIPKDLEDGDVAQTPDSDDPEMDLPNFQPNKRNDAKSTAPPPTNGKQIPKELEDGDFVQAPQGADDPKMELPPSVPSKKGKGATLVAPSPTNGKQIPNEHKNGDAEQESEDDDPETALSPGANVSKAKEKGAEPLTEGRDSKPSAPTPANGKQMPKELDDDDDAKETTMKCDGLVCREDSDTELSPKASPKKLEISSKDDDSGDYSEDDESQKELSETLEALTE